MNKVWKAKRQYKRYKSYQKIESKLGSRVARELKDLPTSKLVEISNLIEEANNETTGN